MISEAIVKVGCKRILAITVVGTWSLSQLLRIGAILIDHPELARSIGVSQEFSALAVFIAGSYFGYSAHKSGVNSKK